MEMSIKNQAIVSAFKRGYRVVNNNVIGLVSNKPLRLERMSSGHLRFGVRFNGAMVKVYVHRLLAYEKYKDDLFSPGMQVRHLDGNPINNTSGNIALGTQSQNMMDIPKAARIKKARTAASKLRKYSDETVAKVRKFHKEDRSYKKTMRMFNIPSKATLTYILNQDYRVPECINEKTN